MNRPWMPLYIADYRADTAHLSAAEHGGYLLLIMHYWQTGGLPKEDGPLARIACMSPVEWKKTRPAIAPFFGTDWSSHKRIDIELAKAKEISSKRSASAQQRYIKSNAIASANAEQKDTHAGAGLPSPSQSKEGGADAPPPQYFFESGVIRLVEPDFKKWQDAFKNLDLKAELIGLTEWAAQQESWFFAVSGALAKRNRELRIRVEQVKAAPRMLAPDGNPWPDGQM